jgi:hypothetical protein
MLRLLQLSQLSGGLSMSFKRGCGCPWVHTHFWRVGGLVGTNLLTWSGWTNVTCLVRGDRRTKKHRQMRVTGQIYFLREQRFVMRLDESWHISICILWFARTLCLSCIMCLMCPSYCYPTKSRQPRSCLWWHAYLHRQANVS